MCVCVCVTHPLPLSPFPTRFLQLLGTVFNFVSHDIQKKVTILQCYRKGGAGDYYYSIQSMIEYEQENNLLTSSDRQSGSRTLLRLHRGLGGCLLVDWEEGKES